MKQNIAVFFGGCSSEYSISLQSASSVIRSLDPDKYRPIPVGITREGDWYYFQGDPRKLLEDRWQDPSDCIPALLSPSRSDRCLLLLQKDGPVRLHIDVALPILHGKNGEDGTLQGLIELAGIPLAGCGTLASALCMDKDRAHKLVGLKGIRVPKAVVLKDFSPEGTAGPDVAFAERTGFPLFVKPVKAGSSFGVTKVTDPAELSAAVRLAFQYDDEVIVEEAIEGFECGCAVLGNEHLITGEIDEIELSGGFFDFTEKYTLKTSSIHVPARISAETAGKLKRTAKTIYRTLGCRGFARVDMFLTPEEEIVFNEVNTIPGFTEHSRYPKMMEAAGLSFREVLDRVIREAI